MAPRTQNGPATTLRQRTNKLKLEPITSAKKQKPLLSLSKPPLFGVADGKGKEKAKEVDVRAESQDDSRLWVDIYEPLTEEDLSVHKRKVDDVRRWLLEAFDGGASGTLRKYRRILVLTGPAGAGKTTTLRVLARELGAEILEWRNTMEEGFSVEEYDRESLTQKFDTFLARATACRPLPTRVSSTSSSSSPSASHTYPLPPSRRRIVLLEDLPNILHAPTQAAFHAALERALASPPQGVPVVIIVSEACGARGQARDEGVAQGGRGVGRDVVDVRTVVPPAWLRGPYVVQISFNPIAPTLMTRALQSLLTKHAVRVGEQNAPRPSKEEMELVVEASGGDIRSAVMALQFASVCSRNVRANGVGKGAKRKARRAGGTRAMMEAITRREHALALFHLLGKVLYNKRKGDAAGQNASARDKAREAALDAQLLDPPLLPPWLAEHERRASRVDADTLYADSPIDSSLFALYLHQNYTEFCAELEHCEGVCEWLSWVDASGGEQWHQANPHQFHLLTLGTLHALPSPPPRKGQRMARPAFFDALRKQREAAEALGDVMTWLCQRAIDAIGASVRDDEGDRDRRSGSGEVMRRAGGRSREETVLEMGSVLRLLEGSDFPEDVPPSAHRLFSAMVFTTTTGKLSLLEDGDVGEEEPDEAQTSYRAGPERLEEKADEGGGWLEDDDIEES